LSVTLSWPASEPVEEGVKVTEIVQVFPPEMPDPQLFVCMKSVVVEIAVMESAALPRLRNVTVCGGLLVETC
jgi:hypothetical protein